MKMGRCYLQGLITGYATLKKWKAPFSFFSPVTFTFVLGINLKATSVSTSIKCGVLPILYIEFHWIILQSREKMRTQTWQFYKEVNNTYAPA